MNKFFGRLKSTGGWTFLEILITVVIMGILASFVSATYGTLQSRIRYSQVRANMDTIAMAGYSDFASNADTTTNSGNIWAPMPMPGTIPPEFVVSKSLLKWPQAPCPGWVYSWDNWDLDNVIRVSLRNQEGTPIWSYCVDNFGGSGNCMFKEDIVPHPPLDITTSSQRYVYCNEL